MAEQFTNYQDMGYNIFGVQPIATPAFISASMNDAYSELGERSVRTSKVKEISADKISGGTISAVTNIGDETIVLDGDNSEIKIYDALGNVSIIMKGGAT